MALLLHGHLARPVAGITGNTTSSSKVTLLQLALLLQPAFARAPQQLQILLIFIEVRY